MYFCSEECQQTQWEAGHKDHCRRPRGNIRTDDFMVIWGLERKPSLNGEIVQVEGPDPHERGRWVVHRPGFENRMSVAAIKLFQLRPLK